MVSKVVIIGGSYAGVETVKKLSKVGEVEIVLISASKKSYFNVAAPRLLSEPDLVQDTLFATEDTLKKYAPSGRFIHAVVTAVDLDTNVVSYDEVGKGSGTVTYDYLVIASGARTPSAAFKLATSYEESISALEKLIERIKSAKSIAVVGGGPTGVESAADIKVHSPEKDVVLYTGDKYPLAVMGKRRARIAQSKLEAKGVVVINDTRVLVKEDNAVELPDGSTKSYDVVIPVYGTSPNTSFLPKKVLNDKGFVVTDSNLRVKGYSNAYVYGDAVADGLGTIVDIKYGQGKVIEKTLRHDIGGDGSKLIDFVPATALTMAVPIGRDGGMGVAFGWGMPSFLVGVLKAKDYMIPKAAENF
ncbi:hypothetical protein TRVA0_012S02278 [Trichomonascus vanleenenianus]|uniref:NAD(P)/FAD-dependent oxidoreductase n=1 Tax=Trichomonascus vanleenenianus TaxID=2268995 RepID=UPI003ECA2D14